VPVYSCFAGSARVAHGYVRRTERALATLGDGRSMREGEVYWVKPEDRPQYRSRTPRDSPCLLARRPAVPPGCFTRVYPPCHGPRLRIIAARCTFPSGRWRL
jgi:hypothetical protein